MTPLTPQELLIRALETDEMHEPLEGAVILGGAGGFVVVSPKPLAAIAPQLRALVHGQMPDENVQVHFVTALT